MREIEALGLFYLGRVFDAERGVRTQEPFLVDARELTTHAVIVGMTGSGKTGLGIALLEEAALDGIPALAIDPKGDLGNLALTFPQLRAEDFEPWIDPGEAQREGRTAAEQAAAVAERWRAGLADWGEDGARVGRFREAADVAIYTPGSQAGIPLSPLRSFSAPPAALAADPEAVRERAQSAVSGLLALVGREADPLRSREHILLARLLGEAWERGQDLDLPGLMQGLEHPPFERMGALELESFYPARERFELAAALNNLLASPAFEPWLEGEPLDVGRLLYRPDGRPRLAVLSIAHLTDAERMFFVTLLLGEVVAWMRAQPGTQTLRALLYMDEVFGYLPPTANPPSKTPLLTLLKQARAFGVGVVLATQNPVDLDYKALSNAGSWFLGRLQTERDRARVIEGLLSTGAGARGDRARLERLLGGLGSRVFVARSAGEDEPTAFQTRFALSYLRGPLTREDLRRLAATRGRPPEGTPPADAERVAPAVAPSVAAAPEAGAAGRPLLPPAIEQVFLPASGAPVRYRARLLVEAQVHYVSAKHDVDTWEPVRLLAPLPGGSAVPDFAAGRELAAGAALAGEPQAGARFLPVPDAAEQPARYAAWGRAAASYLRRGRPLRLLCHEPLALASRPGEDEGAFRVRLRERLREERDAALEQLRGRYARRIEDARGRVAAARTRLQREGDQSRDQALQAAVSLGSSLLGAVLGRRRLSGARTAARAAGRAYREHGDVARAEEALREAEQQLAAAEADLAERLEALRGRFVDDPSAVGELVLAPRKGDLAVERVALAWEPEP